MRMSKRDAAFWSAIFATALAGFFMGYVTGLNNAVESYGMAAAACAIEADFQRANDECKGQAAAMAEDWNAWWQVYRERDQERAEAKMRKDGT